MNMLKNIRIYKACVSAVFSRAMAYRADFLLSTVITLLSNVMLPLVTLVIYNNGASFPGWSMWEVLLIQSVYSMSAGLAAALFNGLIYATMNHIREGSFEVVLLKPLSPLFYLTASNFEPESLGLFAGGLILTIISAVKTGVSSILMWGQFLLLFAGGLCVMLGTFLMMAAILFKWVGNSRIPEIFDSVRTFGKYPLSIFPKALQAVTAFVIPVGMIGFFPASALLGRLDAKAFAALIPCIIFMLAGVWLYNGMVKLYEGVGG